MSDHFLSYLFYNKNREKTTGIWWGYCDNNGRVILLSFSHLHGEVAQAFIMLGLSDGSFGKEVFHILILPAYLSL